MRRPILSAKHLALSTAADACVRFRSAIRLISNMKHHLRLPKITFVALSALLCGFGAVAAEVVPGGVDPPGCEKLVNETLCIALSLRGRIVVGTGQSLAA